MHCAQHLHRVFMRRRMENEEKIAKMKKSELQDALWWVLTESPDWVFERFAREYIIDL